MNDRFLRVITGAVVLVSIAAPGLATVVPRTPSSPPGLRAGAQRTMLRRPASRLLLRSASSIGVTVPEPPGCHSNSGAYNFIGESDPAFPNDAGLNPDYKGHAGVAAGAENEACEDVSGILAGEFNIVGGDGDSEGSVIVGGDGNGLSTAPFTFIGSGGSNLIGTSLQLHFPVYAAIVAGLSNTGGTPGSLIGAGEYNSILGNNPNINSLVYGQSAFIGAGYDNSVGGVFAEIVAGQSNAAVGDVSVIAGGTSNVTSGDDSFIGSGQGNVISTNGSIGGTTGARYAAVAGGLFNTIKARVVSGARYGFIGGGHGNTLTAFNGVIAGGESNTASGDYSTVPGGRFNISAGVDSFAAGHASQALTNGTFVWSDDSSGAKTLTSTAINQFLARASGGFYLYS